MAKARKTINRILEGLTAFQKGRAEGLKRQDTQRDRARKELDFRRKEVKFQREEAERTGSKEELQTAIRLEREVRETALAPIRQVPEIVQGRPTGRTVPFKPIGLRAPGPTGELEAVTPAQLPGIIRRGTAGTISRFPGRRLEAQAVESRLLPPKQKAIFTEAKIEQVVGDLEAGQPDTAFAIAFDRESAERHLFQNLGRNWETILPKEKVDEINEVLDRKYGVGLEVITENFPETTTGSRTKIATDANGNRAEVEVDSRGNITRVIKELP